MYYDYSTDQWANRVREVIVLYPRSMEKAMATHQLFLPGKFHGRRSLVDCRLWGRTESDMTDATAAAAAAAYPRSSKRQSRWEPRVCNIQVYDLKSYCNSEMGWGMSNYYQFTGNCFQVNRGKLKLFSFFLSRVNSQLCSCFSVWFKISDSVHSRWI